MEELIEKYDNFNKAYLALGRAIEIDKKLKTIDLHGIDGDELFSAGIIQHFELAYETAWKFLKVYLLTSNQKEVNSPKDTFKACLTHNVLPVTIVNNLILLADARNETTHIYSKILAREICNDIIKHYEVLGKVLALTKKHAQDFEINLTQR